MKIIHLDVDRLLRVGPEVRWVCGDRFASVFHLSFICLGLLIPLFSSGQSMDNDKMGKILYVLSDTLEGQAGFWQFTVGKVPMMCVTDQINNRMRIIAPIKELSDASNEEISAAMEANFHSVLDVRYAISDQLIWVAFIHPFKELNKEQVISAITQVYNGARTFGTSYSSSELAFPKRKKKELKTKKS